MIEDGHRCPTCRMVGEDGKLFWQNAFEVFECNKFDHYMDNLTASCMTELLDAQDKISKKAGEEVLRTDTVEEEETVDEDRTRQKKKSYSLSCKNGRGWESGETLHSSVATEGELLVTTTDREGNCVSHYIKTT